MSGSPRELFRRMTQLGGATRPAPPEAGSLAALDVEVITPPGLPPGARVRLGDELRRLVEQRTSDTGTARQIALALRTGTDDAGMAASCAGRPLVHLSAADLPAPAEPAWTVAVLEAMDLALLRRPSLLLDPDQAVRVGHDLAGCLRDSRIALYGAVPGLLVDAGLSLTRVREATGLLAVHACRSAQEITEVLVDALAPHRVLLEVAEQTLRAVTRDSATAMVDARAAVHHTTGLEFPDVELLSTAEAAGTVQITFADVRLPATQLGPDATWADVVELLRRTLLVHAWRFVRLRDVERAQNRYVHALPDLVALARGTLPTPLVAACLRSMVRNGDSVRNSSRLMWLLLEADPNAGPPDDVWFPESAVANLTVRASSAELVASGIRRRIAFDAWQVGVPDPETYVCLPADVEAQLLSIPGAPGPAEWRVVRTLAQLSPPYTLVTHAPAALQPVRYAAEALGTVPRVIASQELPPDAPPVPEVPAAAGPTH